MTASGDPFPALDDTWDAGTFRERVQTSLTAFVDEQGGRLAELGEDAARLVAQAGVSVAGGKRFRAAFCYWGYGSVREPGDDETSLVDACSALELLHASALVHDDLMDASDTRRGRPSTHRAFEAEHERLAWRGDAVQYGTAAAILLGDLLLSWADERLRTCGLPHQRVVDALAAFDTTRTEVVLGQFLDVSAQARGAADVDVAMRVLRYKSAKYSIERPLQIGATLAGADHEHLRQLSAFGLPLGEAFQLRDDLLGVYGDPDVTGKPAGDDLVEGKRTVLVALALSRSPLAAADELDAALGTPLDGVQVARLREIITASGAQAEVERMIADLGRRALRALGEAEITEPARAALADLARSATDRVL